ncbi:hypothetical protein ES702_02336 [subsurface metagenome]
MCGIWIESQHEGSNRSTNLTLRSPPGNQMFVRSDGTLIMNLTTHIYSPVALPHRGHSLLPVLSSPGRTPDDCSRNRIKSTRVGKVSSGALSRLLKDRHY